LNISSVREDESGKKFNIGLWFVGQPHYAHTDTAY